MYEKDKTRVIRVRVSDDFYKFMLLYCYRHNFSISDFVRCLFDKFKSEEENYGNIKPGVDDKL